MADAGPEVREITVNVVTIIAIFLLRLSSIYVPNQLA
jgi:hypothetical protein